MITAGLHGAPASAVTAHPRAVDPRRGRKLPQPDSAAHRASGPVEQLVQQQRPERVVIRQRGAIGGGAGTGQTPGREPGLPFLPPAVVKGGDEIDLPPPVGGAIVGVEGEMRAVAEMPSGPPASVGERAAGGTEVVPDDKQVVLAPSRTVANAAPADPGRVQRPASRGERGLGVARSDRGPRGRAVKAGRFVGLGGRHGTIHRCVRPIGSSRPGPPSMRATIQCPAITVARWRHIMSEAPDQPIGVHPAAAPGLGVPPPRRARGTILPAVVAVVAVVAVLILAGWWSASRSSGPRASATPMDTGASGASPTMTRTAPTATRTAPSPTGQGPSTGPTAPTSEGRGYLVSPAELSERAALARSGEQPYADALTDLVRWADGAVERDPRPAVRLRIRGTDGPFVDDTATAYGLALAYIATGDRRYGDAAARYIMAWVDTTTSTRRTCPDSGACQTSLIVSRTVPAFVFAADLLSGTGVLDETSEARFRSWLRDVMLPTASELDNNWGDAGTFTRAVLTDYLGDQDGFAAAIAKWRSLLDLVEADGHIPAEVARGDAGLGYTQEALDYKVAVAVIAARRGVDLWDVTGAKGGSLKGAMDYLAHYMAEPGTWPWSSDVRRRAPSQVWELAYAHWLDPTYAPLVEERRPQGFLGHSAVRWTTLTNGVPIR